MSTHTSLVPDARSRQLAALAYLEQCLDDGRAFVAGAQPTVADCTLAATLQFARFAKIDLIADHRALQRWDTDYRTRAPAQAALTL